MEGGAIAEFFTGSRSEKRLPRETERIFERVRRKSARGQDQDGAYVSGLRFAARYGHVSPPPFARSRVRNTRGRLRTTWPAEFHR